MSGLLFYMILVRYFAKEIFSTVIVISGILLLIFMSNELARYLSMTATGKLFGTQLFHLLLLEIPQLLSLVLPLAFYLSTLLVYGRLYADSEMVVLLSCGLSEKQLLKITLALATAIVIPVALMTLVLNPIVAGTRDQLLAEINATSALQMLRPGRFQAVNQGEQIFYIEKMSGDRQHLENVFVAEHSNAHNANIPDVWTVITAQSGHHLYEAKTNSHFIVADIGYRYEGIPGNHDFNAIHFGEYGVRVDRKALYMGNTIDSTPSGRLLQEAFQHKLDASAEIQWRISLPLCVYLLAFAALPLSRVAPRQGRFAKLFPALLLYIVYTNVLFMGQSWISNGALPPRLGLWLIHLGMLAISLLLWLQQSSKFRTWIAQRQAPPIQPHTPPVK